MSNPTTPFNWQMPTATDLVTDLPADFEVFGQAVATSMADLLGGTTGQILSKTTNADMDFTWTTPNPGDITGVTAGTGISGGGTSGDVTITNSMATAIDAKGDLIAGTGADAFSRLAVGANDLLLTADSTQATGLGYTGAWTTWTPTWTGLTVGNGTVIARYNKIGKVCHLFLKFTFGSTSSITASKPYFTLPLTGSNDNLAANLWISDVGTNDYAGLVQIGTTAGFLVVQNTSSTYSFISAITSTIPMTWTTNDSFTTNFSYEVA